jgi:hypothetical protein
VDVLAGLAGVGSSPRWSTPGLAGSQTPDANLAPTVVYVLMWVGIPFLSILLGDVFRALSPWRAVARGAAWLAGRAAGGGEDAMPAALGYPARLGRWPAALGILAFAWLELVATNGSDPSTLAILALLYAGCSSWG